VTTLNLVSLFRPADLQGRPPLRPKGVYAIAAAAVVAAHILVFATFVHVAQPVLTPLGSIDAELVPEGDFFEAEAIRETDVAPDEREPEQAKTEDQELAAPPAAVPVRDAPRLPAKKENSRTAEKPRPKAERKTTERPDVDRGAERREAQAARRYGAPGGRGGAGSGASQATCLAHVAAALRSHTPGTTSLGPGTAFVTFRVNAGGGISVVSASGTTPAHAALGRRIVAASRGPSTCGAAFASQSIYFD
jgi:protein TonB